MFKMMTSADVAPDVYSDWYIFNTWLQKNLNQTINIEIPFTYSELHNQIDTDKVDIIYANAYDTAMLVRNKEFIPIVKPHNLADEMVIVASNESTIEDIAAIPKNSIIALTNDRDVKLLGMILIEPSDLEEESVSLKTVESGVIAAKHVMNESAHLGFILARSYDQFSGIIKKSLKILVRSEMNAIHHCFMVKPHVLERCPEIQALLISMHDDSSAKRILNNIGVERWTELPREEVEFMIDLMDTMK